MDWTDDAELRELMRALRPRRAGMPLLRFGPRGDSGYLIPDDLEGIGACFSPGVGGASGFEKDCAAAGMQVFMADPSVDGPGAEDARFHFVKKRLGAFCSESQTTMEEWVRSFGGGGDLMLQMDIEGGEYETLLAMSDDLTGRFRIIVGEFHSLGFLTFRPFFAFAAAAFNKVLQTHDCVHIHPNNYTSMKAPGIPSSMEFTFLRKDRMRGGGEFADEFPHSLDCDNAQDRPPLILPACWRGGE